MIKLYKNYSYTLLTILLLLFSFNVNSQCLTSTGPTNDCSYGDAIDNITINGVSVSNAGCSGTGTGYTSFATPVWSLPTGISSTVSLTVGGATYSEGVRIWIDLNANGIFETTESVYNSATAALTHSGNIVIPPGASTAAPVAMRVMCAYQTVPTAANACSNNVGTYGETEDYLVQLFTPCLTTSGPTNDCSYGDAIDNITINGVSVSNAGCSGTGTGYTAFTSPVWSLPLGTTNPFTMAVGGAQYQQGVRIWIDINGNGIFEASESVYASTVTALTHSGNIVIPAVGNTSSPVAMRVMCSYNNLLAATDACNTVGSYGETEDYLVSLVPCADPVITSLGNTPGTFCLGDSTVINITGSLNDATQWSIYSGSCGGTLVGTTTTSDFTVFPPTGSTDYYIRGEGGCTSVTTCNSIALAPALPTSGTDVQTACNSYTWIDGLNYTSSNSTATFTIPNAAGCDSVVTLNLTVNSSNTGVDQQTACDNYTWIDGITYTASNSSATWLLTNSAGCDSLVTLNLTMNTSSSGTDVLEACETYTWIDGATYTSSNSTATFALTNSTGCDSIVTLNLTINNATSSAINATGLDIYTAPSGNQYTSSGTYVDTILNTAGCDSIITISLTMDFTGIEELDQNTLMIYPNPPNDVIYVANWESIVGFENIKIISNNGALVFESDKKLDKIDISKFVSGMYILTVKYETGEKNIRFVKQ